MPERQNTLRRLELPRRWEFLEERAKEAAIDPGALVERVDDAAKRVDTLLRRVRDGGGGVMEVFFGLSGSGKTTFLRTLPKFFDEIDVEIFPKDSPIYSLPPFIKEKYNPLSIKKNRVVVIDRRDNPTPDELSQVEEMFGNLLNVFREPGGAAVVLWPITKHESAKKVAETAWLVGRDSMADAESNGEFRFRGVDKSRYWSLADNTSRTLTGDGLEVFGILQEEANEALPRCETISDYFNNVLAVSERKRAHTWSILKARSITHLWVVLPGNDIQTINATADALTQGNKSKVDVDKVGELIDRPGQDAIYVADWKARRGQLAHLLRAIDVRLFAVPPNVALAAVRSFGDESLKGRLRQKSASLDQSKDTMRASRLYKAILSEADIETSAYAGPRNISSDTAAEYLRVQATASLNDKPLNKALGQLIAVCLAEDAPMLKVVSEKKSLPNSVLQPDIQIQLREGEFICLEPTWRTSGEGIEGEIKASQNTLSESHLKKYMLEKATVYVKDMGL